MAISQLFPTQRPALDLNFARQKRLDPRVTFTRASTGTYVGSDGLIKTAASGEARFDHDPVTGESLGLLVEETRTNQCPYSETFTDLGTDAGWRTSGGTVTPGAAISPSGGSAVSVSGSIYKRINWGSPGTQHTTSVFIKAGTSDWAIISYYNGSGGGGITFTFSTETITVQYSVDNYGFERYPNGWYRVWFTRTSTANLTALSLYLESSGVFFWGAQCEKQSGATFHTSYIPTTTATVTRSADVASLTNSSIYDTDSFTILNEPFGSAAGASTLSLVGAGATPIKRTAVYSQELTQTQINASVGKTDEFWRWRILGSSFGLPSFTTDGQVTVDWGDGTVETLTTSAHTFTDGGGYHEIGFRLDSGTYFQPRIENNATHDTKVVAVGPAPESMKLSGYRVFHGCTALEVFDATVDATGGTNLRQAWENCASLTSFPLIDTSSGTDFFYTWKDCTSLTSFPLVDTSSGADFYRSWYNCNSLTSFPLINTAAGTNFGEAWNLCSSLTSFPLINTAAGTNFYRAWRNCSSLADFPANFFDSWTGTPANSCFIGTWDGCTSLTATSVENILNSIDTSGQSAPAAGVDIYVDYNTGTGTPSVATAVTNLKSRGWTITLNGVPQ